MLFFHSSKDQNIVQIDHYNAFHYEVLEDIIYYGLESGWTVGHPEEHYQGFEQTSIGLEDCLPLVSRLNANIIETLMDV